MELVQIRHPKLERTVSVPKSAVPHHVRAGWLPVEAEEQEQTPTDAAEGGDPTPRTRRRASDKEGE